MSQVPAVIDALVGRWSALDDLTDVQVVDGPQVSDSMANDWVLVGYDGDAGGEGQAASTEQEWAGLGTLQEERISLTVAVMSLRGSTDIAAARTRVYGIADVLALSLRIDPTAGLPRTQIRIGASALRQSQTSDGAQALLLLTLACDTFA